MLRSAGAMVLVAAFVTPFPVVAQRAGDQPDFTRLGLQGALVYLQTREACEYGSVADAAASELVFDARTPKRARRRIGSGDIVAIVRLERAPSRAAPRVAATIALGALAVVAGWRDRPSLAAGLGLSAGLVPWWGWNETRRGTLVHVAPGAPPARLPGPGATGCELTMHEARLRAR